MLRKITFLLKRWISSPDICIQSRDGYRKKNPKGKFLEEKQLLRHYDPISHFSESFPSSDFYDKERWVSWGVRPFQAFSSAEAEERNVGHNNYKSSRKWLMERWSVALLRHFAMLNEVCSHSRDLQPWRLHSVTSKEEAIMIPSRTKGKNIKAKEKRSQLD